MRIGIDARELSGKPTGVGRHLAGLLGAWTANANATRHSFVLYAHGQLAVPRADAGERPLGHSPMSHTDVRVIPGDGGTTWEQISMPQAARRDHLDVFFAPGYTAPLTLRAPTVVLVHDLSFVTHAQWFGMKEGFRRRLITRWSSKRARTVLTVSETARAEIIDCFGLPPARVRCIYPGVAMLRRHSSVQIEREPLVLFVGSIFNRRHLPDLIRAVKPIARDHPAVRLEIVGDNRTYPYQDLPAIVAAEGLEGTVAVRPYMFDDGLADLYGRARAFAFLSEYEGFGHPPLEALSVGVPSVLLDTPVAREVCGDAALFVANGDIDGIRSALECLLFDDHRRAELLNAAPEVLARYSWSRSATETLQVLEAACG
jgi:glycosyltransferase involved in cell wall biosynthesis